METLKEWDYRDPVKNGGVQQVNRQKSALNQQVIYLDHSEKLGVFEERPSAHSTPGRFSATLETCTCSDFGIRKVQYPCKHQYALAFELGLIRPQHFDARARAKMERDLPPEERQRLALEKMHAYSADLTQWGGWNKAVHRHYSQMVRQVRAYDIIDHYPEQITETGKVNGYTVDTMTCTCPDFAERRLPCKHMYCVAVRAGHDIGLSRATYQAQRCSEIELLTGLLAALNQA